MRPKIMPSHSIARTLQYNEQKVTTKQAECIYAANFLKDVEKLSFDDKLQRMQRRMQLNENVSTNVHITLNFDPLDKLTNEKMQAIAEVYMKEIGFGTQPYLVYRHNDAGHPHCHVVTTHVQANGNTIVLYNLGRNQSEKARHLIEHEFDLVTKERKQELRQQQVQKLTSVPMVRYGEKALAPAVSNVLEYVTEKYIFTSLEDYNTILRLYNVEAYRGKENTQLYQNRGLLYRVLDENGKYIGLPLKASFFDCKPTLDRLEEKFIQNQKLKETHRDHLENYLKWNLFQQPRSLEDLSEALRQDKITMICIQDKDKTIQKLSFVDFHTFCVFKAEDLPKEYGIPAIQEIVLQEQTQTEELTQRHRQHHYL